MTLIHPPSEREREEERGKMKELGGQGRPGGPVGGVNVDDLSAATSGPLGPGAVKGRSHGGHDLIHMHVWWTDLLLTLPGITRKIMDRGTNGWREGWIIAGWRDA